MPENELESSLPPMLTVVQAAEIMGIGRTLAYELVRANSWPTPVVRAGRLIRIPSGPLMALVSTGSVSGDPHAA
jgi:excisionase family DNA binding protein